MEEKKLAKRSMPRKRYVKQEMDTDFFSSFSGENGERSVCEIVLANLIVFSAVFLSAWIPVVSVALPVVFLIYFQIGLYGFVYKKEYGENFRYEDLFVPIKIFIKSFCVFVIKFFLTIFWLVVFIVPGVIVMLDYCFSSLILFESQDMDVRSVLSLSRELVKGYRLKIFFFAMFSLATICVSMSLMLSIILLFDWFLVVPSTVYIVLILFAGILDFILLALPLFEVVLVDCYASAKKRKTNALRIC